jgi:hypothetical protein
MDTDPDRGALPWPRASSAAGWLGYLCVLPLVLGLAAVGLLPDYATRELAQRITVAWGAALLAFTGAVHWGFILAGRLPGSFQRVGAALAPALIGAAAVVITGQRALALLVVGFGGFWLYEHRALGAALPKDYLDLRRALSMATCVVLALTMFVSDGAGLG